ncbi:uncharacterized protein F54H12.2-like [Ambystoma mexicanum]|uniref:uncharacterized protein F54H12.2-like n=1 Tax=Ambystoma mexicanum TaxID=8296 RepID=UPI0037E8DEF6
MAFLHRASGECVKSQLDLFTVPPTQTGIDNSFYMVSPLAALSLPAPIEFFVSGSTDMYLYLNDTLLHLNCKITKPYGTNIAGTLLVGMISYPIATIFNQVDISLGGQLITQSDNMYPYRAHIEILLNYSHNVMDMQLSVGLFFCDNAGHFDNTALDVDNKGLVTRALHARTSRVFDLLGRLHADLFFQDKLLINSVDLKVNISRNTDAFCLMSRDAEQCKLVIIWASLFVKRVSVSLTIRLAHAGALQISNMKYPVESVTLKVFSIPTLSRGTSQDNLFLGQLPKIIIMGIVKTVLMTGTYDRNPFDFKHFNMNYAALHKDGVLIPAKAYAPSFVVLNIIREYMGLVAVTGKHMRDAPVSITCNEYALGYTLLAIDLRPNNASEGHFNFMRSGNLWAEIKFKRK